MRLQKHGLIGAVIVSSLMLSACVEKTGLTKIASKPVLAGAALGATSGAIITGIAAVPLLGGAAAGGLAGSAIANAKNSAYNQSQRLRAQGATIYQIGEQVTIVLPSDNMFKIRTHKLTSRGNSMLSHVEKIVSQAGEPQIYINGYTDNIGDNRINRRLAKGQAQAVAAYLWSSGTPFERLHTKGHGEHPTIASNHNMNGSAQNRRIEITFNRPAV